MKKQILALLLTYILIILPIAVTGLEITHNPREDLEIQERSVNIKFTTDKESSSIIKYGRDKDKIDQTKGVPALVINHEVELRSLIENTKYYYLIESSNSEEGASDNNKGRYYTFTTGKPRSQTRFIDVDIPSFIRTEAIDIQGTTFPGATVKLYIDDVLSGQLVSNDEGDIIFQNRFIGKTGTQHTVKISAETLDGEFKEVTFVVNIDSTVPIVKLDPIESPILKKEITVTGSVSEEVTLTISVTRGSDDNPPSKVENLVEKSTSSNSIEITWDKIEDSDFKQYVVYREDVDGPIAVITSSSNTRFLDNKVNSSTEYTYRIAVMDSSGNIGPQSEPIKAKTLDGTFTSESPKPINLTSNEERVNSATINGQFAQKVSFSDGDGVYKLVLRFTDKAGNEVTETKVLRVDSSPPKIRITDPPGGTPLYENYADEVDISGTTEPGANVYLWIARAPFTTIENQIEQGGVIPSSNIPDTTNNANIDESSSTQLQTMDEKNFQTDSDSDQRADYHTVADDNGNFVFKNVDLVSSFSAGISIREVSPTDFTSTDPLIAGSDIQSSIKQRVPLTFIAVDEVGLKGKAEISYNLRTCWSGNFTWDIRNLPAYQSPTMLSTERLADGTETINFYLNLSYLGSASEESAAINNVVIRSACDNNVKNDPRFNFSCQIFSGCSEEPVDNNPNLRYVTCNLAQIKGMDRWLKADWKSFFNAISQEMVFPLHVRVSYSQGLTQISQPAVDFEQIKSVTVGTTSNSPYRSNQFQSTCMPITYFVDGSKIDFREFGKLSDFLLFDFVDFLNSTISSIEKFQNQLEKVVEVIGYACLGSFLAMTAVKIYRRATCNVQQLTSIFKRFTVFEDPEDSRCKQCMEHQFSQDSSDDDPWKKFLGFINYKRLSDTCLEICAPGCSGAWKAEAKVYNAYRLTCDRLFGHDTPSRWTETRSDSNLVEYKDQKAACAADLNTPGRPLVAESCNDLFRDQGSPRAGTFLPEEQCVEVKESENSGTKEISTVYRISEDPVASNDLIHALSGVLGLSKAETIYAIKQTDRHYLTNQPKTCSEVCGSSNIKSNNRNLRSPTFGESERNENDEGDGLAGDCRTQSYCEQINDQIKKGGAAYTAEFNNIKENIVSARNLGYTQNCFYGPGREMEVSTNPEENVVCCCVSTNEDVKPVQIYYQPQDIEPRDPTKGDYGEFGPPYENLDDSEENLKNMKWSYRYAKEKWVAPDKIFPNPTPPQAGPPAPRETLDSLSSRNRYNPDRYIKERDFPACFGQNYWGLDNSANPSTPKVLRLDPAKQFGPVLYCGSVGQMHNRLTVVKNLMTAMKGCLIDVRYKGGVDTGVCKELFNQYVCSMFWRVISEFTGGCQPTIEAGKEEPEVPPFGKKFQASFRGVWEGLSESVNDITSEYGNVKLNNYLGVGQEGIARRICLGAFGFDWEVNAHTLIDLAYTQPFATLVQPLTKSRELLAFDPNSFESSHEYRASWIINPGCDLDFYRVELACVGREDISQPGVDCSKQNDPYGVNCDCRNGDTKTRGFYNSRATIQQNKIENIDHSPQPINSQYRFDHLKFTLQPSRKILPELQNKCFGQGHENGVYFFPIRDKTARVLAGCQIDTSSGVFDCSGGQGLLFGRGTSSIEALSINGFNTRTAPTISVVHGTELEYDISINNRGDEKCLKIRNTNGIEFVDEINRKGPSNYQGNIGQAGISITNLPSINPSTCVNKNDNSCFEEIRNTRFAFDQPILDSGNTIQFNIKLESNNGQPIKFESSSNTKITFNGGTITRDGKSLATVNSLWDNNKKGIVINDEDLPEFNGIRKFSIILRNLGISANNNYKELIYQVVLPQSGDTGYQDQKISFTLHYKIDPKKACTTENVNPEIVTFNNVPQQKQITIRVNKGELRQVQDPCIKNQIANKPCLCGENPKVECQKDQYCKVVDKKGTCKNICENGGSNCFCGPNKDYCNTNQVCMDNNCELKQIDESTTTTTSSTSTPSSTTPSSTTFNEDKLSPKMQIFVDCLIRNDAIAELNINSKADSRIPSTCSPLDLTETFNDQDNCIHSKNSCHYGGTSTECQSHGSYAIDVNKDVNKQKLITKSKECEPSVVIYDESTHYHVSIGWTNACGCDQPDGPSDIT